MVKITIYGLSGTGKTTVGKLLAEKLKIEFVSSGNIMRANATALGLSFEQFKELREKDSKYDDILDKYIKNYGKTHDNFVVESRLAWYFIPDSFKVKFFCDLDVRIERIVRREGESFEDQKEITETRDRINEEIYRKLYGIKNLNADENFDFVIDVTKPTPEEIVEKIISVLK